jgi:hypothetical protein
VDNLSSRLHQSQSGACAPGLSALCDSLSTIPLDIKAKPVTTFHLSVAALHFVLDLEAALT